MQGFLIPVASDERNQFVAESMSADVNTKLIGEMSCVAGRLSHNEEERYIAVMKELQFGEPLRPVTSFYHIGSALYLYRYCSYTLMLYYFSFCFC